MGIKCFGQTTVLVEDNIVVYFDPCNLAKKKKLLSADYILLSGFVFDKKSIEAITGKKTKILSSPILSKELDSLDFSNEVQVIAPQEEFSALSLKAIPAYQLKKILILDLQTYNGYLLKIAGKTYYFAGPTELTPEMNLIKADIAVLPVAGKTMDLLEALAATNVVDAKLFVPNAYAKEEKDGLIACKRFTMKCTYDSDLAREESDIPEMSVLHDEK